LFSAGVRLEMKVVMVSPPLPGGSTLVAGGSGEPPDHNLSYINSS
jgi:hypothetical protein